MIFEQKFTLPLPIGKLWEFMIDAPAVSACLPGIEEFSETSKDRYAGRVRIKVGPIVLRMEGEIAITERDQPSWTARMTAEGRDRRIAGGVKANVAMTLTPTKDSETEFKVLTDAAVFGKLGEFGQPLIKRSADRILQQFVQNIIGKLSLPAAAAPAATENALPKRKIAALKNAEISYLELGAGPSLVLLHGIGSMAVSWKHQLIGLSDCFRVIAWDAPGYGESTALSEPTPPALDYAARLAEFLDERGVGQCHLVGHSLGALIAANFAANHPDRIFSLTLASIAIGHARLPEDERQRLRNGRLDDLANLGPRAMAEKRGPRLVSADAPEDVRQAVIDTMANIHPDGYGQAVCMLSQGDTVADVAKLRAQIPVQILFGSADIITTPEQNMRVAAVKPDALVRTIEGAGHAMYLERPAAFNALLAEFIGKL